MAQRGRQGRWWRVASAVGLWVALAGLVVPSQPVEAHDPAAWGGLYRSYDAGATWTLLTQTLPVNDLSALAFRPADPTHL